MRRPHKRRFWTTREIRLVSRLFADTPTSRIARLLGRPVQRVYAKANALGLRKSARYMRAMLARMSRRLAVSGAAHRFPKGHVPANKGLRRPGWAPGRMAQTQFKPGGFPLNRDPDFYVPGALRVNSDGYIDMRVSFDPGANGWRALHKILWEDAHGPVPAAHVVTFRNGDKLDVELGNLELLTFTENMRRNTIHRYPPELKSAIRLVGKLKRTIREEQDRRLA